MRCVICRQEGAQYYCLDCILKYAVQAGASKKKFTQLLSRDVSGALERGVVGSIAAYEEERKAWHKM